MYFQKKGEILKYLGYKSDNYKAFARLKAKGMIIEDYKGYTTRTSDEVRENRKKSEILEENKRLKAILGLQYKYLYTYIKSVDPMVKEENLRMCLENIVKQSDLDKEVKEDIETMRLYVDRDKFKKLEEDNKRLRNMTDNIIETVRRRLRRKVRMLDEDQKDDFVEEIQRTIGIEDKEY